MSSVNLKTFKAALNKSILEGQEMLERIEALENLKKDRRVQKLLDISANIQTLSDDSGVQVVNFTDQYGELIYSRAEITDRKVTGFDESV